MTLFCLDCKLAQSPCLNSVLLSDIYEAKDSEAVLLHAAADLINQLIYYLTRCAAEVWTRKADISGWAIQVPVLSKFLKTFCGPLHIATFGVIVKQNAVK